jgi:hypothetical protein
MIQPLRRAHRYWFFSLALILPVTLFVGLRARHPIGRPQAPSGRVVGKAEETLP